MADYALLVGESAAIFEVSLPADNIKISLPIVSRI